MRVHRPAQSVARIAWRSRAFHQHRPPARRSGRRASPLFPLVPSFLALLFALMTLCAAAVAIAQTPARPQAAVVVIVVNGAIGPASADFVVRTLERAARQRAPLAILQLDTPGGLDTSMRQIIKAILASPVPVAAYVAPGGARAASAGTYIVYASHLAAMAPGTNLGAASPVQIGGGAPGPAGAPALPGAASPASGNAGALPTDTASTETRKATQDAAAYIRGLAQLRGRNAEWAERAVREAVSLSASEALAQHVIDLIAPSAADLAREADGRVVATAAGMVRIATAHAPLVNYAPDWRNRFLSIIADPNVALILLTIGVYGLFFEFANPGFVLPGVAGAICLLVGLFAMQMLPVNYAGLGLVLFGLACLVAEAFLPTFGVLGFGGIVAFAIGALMLIDTDVPGYGVPLPLIAGLALGGAALVALMSSVALRARKRPVVTGAEALVGSLGVILDDGLNVDAANRSPTPHATADGWARVHGERWRVTCALPLAAGTPVRVTARSGLTLSVVPLHDANGPPQSQGEST
ncbi:NfeD family protein [Paraburkholderia tropica]|uniref:NfeD family protein n=1 Tax=Paraburkholderia tropica TaxID=92647 RepID=UPI003CD0A005